MFKWNQRVQKAYNFAFDSIFLCSGKWYLLIANKIYKIHIKIVYTDKYTSRSRFSTKVLATTIWPKLKTKEKNELTVLQ